MKRALIVVCLFLTVSSCKERSESTSLRGPITEVLFDDSMGKNPHELQCIRENPDDVTRYVTLKALYEQYAPSKVASAPTPRIPKIIHQIWLGPKPQPPSLAAFRTAWLTTHPDWEYRLWTDVDLDDLNLELRDLIDDSQNYAEKSDILRSELLERFGGMYIDVDMECRHALTELHHKYDFYAGVEFPHKIATTDNHVWVGISLIASRPHHPILQRWKELIRAGWGKVNTAYVSGIERVINHTYFPFTEAFLEKCHEPGDVNIAFPATYFYPLNATHAAKRRSFFRAIRERFYDFLETLHMRTARPYSRVYPETLAVHYWGNSWLPSAHEQLKDLQRQVDSLRREFVTLQKRIRQLQATQLQPAVVTPIVEAPQPDLQPLVGAAG